MGVVTAKQLKNQTGEVLRRVREGETVTVTVRGIRVAQFVPLGRKARNAQTHEARKALRTLVQSIKGKYRGIGTVEEFLAEKAQEIQRER